MRKSPNKDEIKALALKLGRIIANHRREKGLSQEVFAELVNCHRTYVGIVERGERNITIYTLQEFSAALGLSSSDLLREAGL